MKSIKIFIFTGLIACLSVTLFNYISDPYNYFNFNPDYVRANAVSEYERFLIYPFMKKSKDIKFAYAVIGASPVEESVDEKYFAENINDKGNCFRMTLSPLRTQEQYELIKAFIKIHPEVKTIFISFDYFISREKRISYLPEFKEGNLTFKEISFLLWNLSTTKNSINKLKENIVYSALNLKNIKFLNKIDKIKNYKICYPERQVQPRLRYTDLAQLKILQENFECLNQTLEMLKKNNINFVIFTNPLHNNILADIYHQNLYDEFEQYKRELAKVHPFYDFDYINKYSDEPISLKNKTWRNSFHYNNELSNIIFKKMVLNQGDFGVYVTDKNIDSVLTKQRKELEKYMQTHKKELETFFSYKHRDLSTDDSIKCDE